MRHKFVFRKHRERDDDRVERAKVQRKIEQRLTPTDEIVYDRRDAYERNGEKHTCLCFAIQFFQNDMKRNGKRDYYREAEYVLRSESSPSHINLLYY
jgi:hypothetical protein